MALKRGGPERRQFGRRQTAFHGWIHIAGRPPKSCIMRNISKGGALLEFDAPTWMPFHFRLKVDPAGIDTWCELRHQGSQSVGVLFIAEPADAHAEPDDPLARIEQRSLDDKATWSGN